MLIYFKMKQKINRFLDGNPIKEGGSYEFSNVNNTYSLKIKSPNESNNGTYRAVFKNELGTIETKAHVSVLSNKSRIMFINYDYYFH